MKKIYYKNISAEENPARQLQNLGMIERFLKEHLSGTKDAEKLRDALEKLGHYKAELTAALIPKRIYINLRPVFASVAFTVPDLQADIPENPSPQPTDEGFVVTLKNNGKYQRSTTGHKGLEGRNWDARTEIESADVFDQHYTGEDLLRRMDELLKNFFVHMFGGQELVDAMIENHAKAGLKKGAYLYRAITRSDLTHLNRKGTIC